MTTVDKNRHTELSNVLEEHAEKRVDAAREYALKSWVCAGGAASGIISLGIACLGQYAAETNESFHDARSLVLSSALYVVSGILMTSGWYGFVFNRRSARQAREFAESLQKQVEELGQKANELSDTL